MNVRDLQLEIAKLSSKKNRLSSQVEEIKSQLAVYPEQCRKEKASAISAARKEFMQRQKNDLDLINATCNTYRSRVLEFLADMPNIDKEFAGKYEIKSIESKLCEGYPDELVKNFVGFKQREFDEDSEAYEEYLFLERKSSSVYTGSPVSRLFSSIQNGCFSLLDSADSHLGKVGIVASIGAFALLFVYPVVPIVALQLVGLSSFAYGFFVRSLLSSLTSIKNFLNESYDEDIFRQDSDDILKEVDKFLDYVKKIYSEDVDAREFDESSVDISSIESQYNEKTKVDNARLSSLELDIKNVDEELAKKMQALEDVEQKSAKFAEEQRESIYKMHEWEYKWHEDIIIDITEANKVVGYKWKKCNSLYVSKDIAMLQNFSQLVSFQFATHTHPLYANQYAMDYKYMGGKFTPIARLGAPIFDLYYIEDKRSKYMERLKDEIESRCTKILSACESLDDFNELMKTYDAPGESYVIVHIFGLNALSQDLRLYLRNGAKVGYFFKLYMTTDEYKDVAKDFPVDSFSEYCVVDDKITPVAHPVLNRIVGVGT